MSPWFRIAGCTRFRVRSVIIGTLLLKFPASRQVVSVGIQQFRPVGVSR
jgi:hypothetical protein